MGTHQAFSGENNDCMIFYEMVYITATYYGVYSTMEISFKITKSLTNCLVGNWGCFMDIHTHTHSNLRWCGHPKKGDPPKVPLVQPFGSWGYNGYTIFREAQIFFLVWMAISAHNDLQGAGTVPKVPADVRTALLGGPVTCLARL